MEIRVDPLAMHPLRYAAEETKPVWLEDGKKFSVLSRPQLGSCGASVSCSWPMAEAVRQMDPSACWSAARDLVSAPSFVNGLHFCHTHNAIVQPTESRFMLGYQVTPNSTPYQRPPIF